MPEKNWEINEKKCLEYLKKTFSTEVVRFEGQGGSDSTEPDIIVLKNGKKACYIEVKMDNAQCGQFVLFPNTEERIFEYSTGNHPSEPTNESNAIIELMENDFDRYCCPGTTGINLEMDKSYFYNWIIEYYRSKGVEYFISLYNNQYFIFPVRNFDKYFDVSGSYRKKKSGSCDPAKKDYPQIKKFFSEHCPNVQFKNIGKKFLVLFYDQERKILITINGINYQLAKQDDNWYRMTRLSNTNNPNVIFSISLIKRAQEASDLNDFKCFLGMH